MISFFAYKHTNFLNTAFDTNLHILPWYDRQQHCHSYFGSILPCLVHYSSIPMLRRESCQESFLAFHNIEQQVLYEISKITWSQYIWTSWNSIYSCMWQLILYYMTYALPEQNFGPPEDPTLFTFVAAGLERWQPPSFQKEK